MYIDVFMCTCRFMCRGLCYVCVVMCICRFMCGGLCIWMYLCRFMCMGVCVWTTIWVFLFHKQKENTRSNGVFTPEQDNDKTNVEPVHSYDALHTVVAGPGVKILPRFYNSSLDIISESSICFPVLRVILFLRVFSKSLKALSRSAIISSNPMYPRHFHCLDMDTPHWTLLVCKLRNPV